MELLGGSTLGFTSSTPMGLPGTGVLYTLIPQSETSDIYLSIYISYGQNNLAEDKAPDLGVPCFETNPYESIV